MGSVVEIRITVNRDIIERANRYGINISEVLVKSLEREIRRRERLRRLAAEVSEELRRISETHGADFVVRVIREGRGPV